MRKSTEYLKSALLSFLIVNGSSDRRREIFSDNSGDESEALLIECPFTNI